MGITILKYMEGYTIPLSSGSHRLAGRSSLGPEPLGAWLGRCGDPWCLDFIQLIQTLRVSLRFTVIAF